jgi:hypothetical protein
MTRIGGSDLGEYPRFGAVFRSLGKLGRVCEKSRAPRKLQALRDFPLLKTHARAILTPQSSSNQEWRVTKLSRHSP